MKRDLYRLRDLADALLDEDGILAVDSLARTWWNQGGGAQGGRLGDALSFVESHKAGIGLYLRSVRQMVVPVTQFAIASGFDEVAAMTTDADLNLCVPGNGHGQSTAGWMAINEENHPVLVAYLLRKMGVKNGQERAIGEQLAAASKQRVIPPSRVSQILAASRSQLPTKRALLSDGEGS